MDFSNEQLLQYLAEILEDEPKITEEAFNRLKNKPATERVYRRIWGTFKKAKAEAVKLTPETPSFDFKKEKSKKTIQELRKELKRLQGAELTTEEIRQYIFELKDSPVDVPKWLVETDNKPSGHGVPSLLLSDWHIGEVVRPDQMFNINEFNLEVAGERVQRLAEGTIDLLTNHLPSNYPGLVLILGGDFVSGNIHDELRETNQVPIMPAVLKTFGMLIWFIEEMLKHFPKLMVFGVPGNHARTTKKPGFKDVGATSFDWLIYQLLNNHFDDNSNIQFNITSGKDLHYKVYETNYHLTHGDCFRGGTGFLGSLAPITRGTLKKQLVMESVNMKHDMLVMGHFHSLMFLPSAIVNGSLIGYNEFALNNHFLYESPRQALWITNPKRGITFQLPVFCTEQISPPETSWVSWAE